MWSRIWFKKSPQSISTTTKIIEMQCTHWVSVHFWHLTHSKNQAANQCTASVRATLYSMRSEPPHMGRLTLYTMRSVFHGVRTPTHGEADTVFHGVRTPTHGEADTVYHEVSIPWGQNPHTWGGWHCIPCGQKPTHDTTSAYLPSSRCLKKKCRQRQTTLYEVSRHKPAVFLEDSTRDRDMLENALAL